MNGRRHAETASIEPREDRVDASRLRDTVTRIEMEFREMPGLKLTAPQACRLFGLPAELCDPALDVLVGNGFLSRGRDGTFIRRAQLIRHIA